MENWVVNGAAPQEQQLCNKLKTFFFLILKKFANTRIRNTRPEILLTFSLKIKEKVYGDKNNIIPAENV